jgi:hypothetical protein
VSSEWAMVIVTLVLVCITAWYARETSRMAKRMTEQTNALVAPRVVVRAERRDGSVYLIVENQGASSACDLRLATDKEVPTNDRDFFQPLTDHRLFRNPPSQLAPGERSQILMASEEWVMRNPNYYKPRLMITASYTWRGGTPITEMTPIEIDSLWSLPQWINATRKRDF